MPILIDLLTQALVAAHVYTYIYTQLLFKLTIPEDHPHSNRVVVGRGVLHYPHHPLTEKTSCRAQFARVSLLFSPTFIFLSKRGIPIVKFAVRTAVPGIHPLEIAMATPAPHDLGAHFGRVRLSTP